MGPRRTDGYTIIELLLVMIIIGVLAGITYVRMAPTLEGARVRGAASLLAGDLQYAQVLAARRRLPVVVSVNSAAQVYQLVDRLGTVVRTREFGATGDADLPRDLSQRGGCRERHVHTGNRHEPAARNLFSSGTDPCHEAPLRSGRGVASH
jgi:prepilin-type N-terminal cleavage/methylation domain-containing protein